ncbi:MAG: hypothetical protein SFX73_30140 [Kofleriaceae bacterium]|nr:hypothetical protein [Kofleriaceae bacterium]
MRRPDAEAIGAAFATGAHGAVYIGETDRRIGSADDDRYVRDDATYSCSAATIDGTVVGIFVVSVGT